MYICSFRLYNLFCIHMHIRYKNDTYMYMPVLNGFLHFCSSIDIEDAQGV